MSQRNETGSVSESIRSLLGGIDYLQVVGKPLEIAPQPGVFEPVSEQLHPRVAQYLTSKYPGGLYRHQARAITSALAGHHTIVTTKTSSGKSVIFMAPVVDSMLRDERATGLFIYPTRALANDQYFSLKNALEAVGIYSLDSLKTSVAVKKYDGSTEQHHRKAIREHGRAILTNPDMLHIGILSNHELWDRFFRNLKYVVIDEAHEYRGVFGSNVAYLMRRIRQICRLYGSDPVFIATSATCKNPLEHARNLTGLEFTLIGSEQDGSIQGRKTYFLAQSRGMTEGSHTATSAPVATASLPVARALGIDLAAPAEIVRVAAEAQRLTYGHLFNPAFATETSKIDPLPHQRIAVYERMLPQTRLRYLLVDDPGAGKTIMAGLYIREMLMRRLVRRVLIIPPAGLVGNWQREMAKLFSLTFRVPSGSDARHANPFKGEGSDLVIVSVDTLGDSRGKMFARLAEEGVERNDTWLTTSSSHCREVGMRSFQRFCMRTRSAARSQ